MKRSDSASLGKPGGRSFTPQQQETLDALVSWLATREREGHLLPRSAVELEDAIKHSGLLRRLLVQRQAPLPVPPPTSNGMPWYELVERGFAHCSVKHAEQGLEIDGSLWEIVAQPEPFQYRVRYRSNGPDYLVWRIGRAPASHQDKPAWMIEAWSGD